jgi:CDGSH-type Zn-finger protein
VEQPATEQAQHITVTEDGPYKVEGGTEILNAEGQAVTKEGTAFLCRCGGSQNKPFCDGTHWHIGFKDPA